MISSARGELTRAQERYKASFDKAVRPKNQDLKKDDPVFLRVEVHGAGRSTKLERQAHGPLYVERNDGHTFLLRNRGELIRVSSDRVTAFRRTALPRRLSS